MKSENERRRKECKTLFDMFIKEREKASENLSRETSQVRDMIEKEGKAMTEQLLSKEKEVQEVQDELNKRNEALEKETASIRDTVIHQLDKVAVLSESMLSVYFNAVR